MKKLISCVVALIFLLNCKPGKEQQIDTTLPVAGYSYPAKQALQTYEYQGIITGFEGRETQYDLSISRSEYSSDGKYILITTHQQINNRKQQSNTSRGSLEVQRGSRDDPNAKIYKLTDEVDDTILHLQLMGNNRLRLLTNQLPDTLMQSAFNYDLELVQ